MAASRVLVVGQLARDLVLTVPELPGPNSAVEVGRRRELPGGKGANQAVALAQPGVPPTLLAVVAAGTSIGHPGGRPDLRVGALADQLADAPPADRADR